MRYREILPSSSAARFVKCYWLLEDGDPQSTPQRIVPDGRSELIFNVGHPYEFESTAGWNPQPRSFLIGQITSPLLLRAAGPVKVIGIRFHPHTASQLLKIPIGEFTDAAAVPIDAFSGDLARELNRLSDAPDWSSALDLILQGLAARVDKEDRTVSFAVAEIERCGGLAGVGALADYVGLSSRQFERRFTQAVGIPPKLFSRLQRFQRVFPALEDPNSQWADKAIDCGYYDQAHLIRDFKEFAGKPPLALLAAEIDLSRRFLRSPSMSDFSNTAVRTSH